jgi:hypothetical protein
MRPPVDPALHTCAFVMTSVHDRVMFLVRHALSATANANEAHSAAMLVCRSLQRYPELLNTETAGVPDSSKLDAPPHGRAQSPSGIHPSVDLEWEAFTQEHRIEIRLAVLPGLCLACGEAYRIDEHVLQQPYVGITHEACGGWWRNFDFDAPEKGLEDLIS